jgi:hypothetical protein
MADTAPAPRLVLDVEMGSRFTPSRKVVWDPKRFAPPEPDGTWDTAIVPIREYDDILRAYEWLNSGKHPFRSVVLDSISEGQQRAVSNIAGMDQMDMQKWGTLLRQLGDLARKLRDLTTHPVRPLDAVVIIAMTHQRNGDGPWTPFVQGQLRVFLPYLFDVLGYLSVVQTEDGSSVRRLFVGPTPGYETGERVGGKLGPYIDNPNVTDMLAMVRGDDSDAKDEVA